MLKYYGVWEKRFKHDKRAMAQAVKHLMYIREEEAKNNPLYQIFKKKR